MEIGLFMVPFRDPSTGMKEGFEWDMQVIRWAEEFGLSEVWVAEHSTMRWEPVASPELYIAAALSQTKNIKFGTGANIPGNHNPMALAYRLMQLDHMSGGRLMIGLGNGAYASDHKVFGNDDPVGRGREAIQIMRKIWEEKGPYKFEGKYWSFEMPDYDEIQMGPFWEPFQKPHPPLLMAGLSPASNTLRAAGKLGYLPMSFNVSREYLEGHWYRYMQGATESGFIADRNDWRVATNIFVADTDEEAMDAVVNGAMGKCYREWMLPGYARGHMLPVMAPELGTNDPDKIPIEFLAEEKWLVGSPDTIMKKLDKDLKASGGFGKIISFTFDYLDQPDVYRRHFELLGTEIIPRLAEITHQTESLTNLKRPEGITD